MLLVGALTPSDSLIWYCESRNLETSWNAVELYLADSAADDTMTKVSLEFARRWTCLEIKRSLACFGQSLSVWTSGKVLVSKDQLWPLETQRSHNVGLIILLKCETSFVDLEACKQSVSDNRCHPNPFLIVLLPLVLRASDSMTYPQATLETNVQGLGGRLP